jgi:hypothetical protein
MKNQDYTTSFSVDQTPEDAFAAINDVRGWWSGNIEGETDKLGAEFTYRYKDLHYSRQRITEMVRGRKVVWQVVDSAVNFVADTEEWNGTKILFEISTRDNRTEVRFTHAGLVPQAECFSDCSKAWSSYINGSLKRLITTGKGQPNQKEP